MESGTPRVELYGADWCGYTYRARQLLEAEGVRFVFHDLDSRPDLRQRLFELSGNVTVPQVLVDERPIGGYAELVALRRAGELNRLAGSVT